MTTRYAAAASAIIMALGLFAGCGEGGTETGENMNTNPL